VAPAVSDVILTVVCGCHTRVLKPRLSTTMYLMRSSPPLSVDEFHASDTLFAVVPVTRSEVGVVGADPLLFGAAPAAGTATSASTVSTSSTVEIRVDTPRDRLVRMTPPPVSTP
jgi:hypothetical protein